MPYYGVPIGVTYEGVHYEESGMAFSEQIVTDLLRKASPPLTAMPRIVQPFPPEPTLC